MAALAGAFLVATLPLANVHVALAGYADLPMAAYYTGAALAILRWTHGADPRRGSRIAVRRRVHADQESGARLGADARPRRSSSRCAAPGTEACSDGVLAWRSSLLAVLAQTHPVIFNYRLHLDFAPAWARSVESYFLLGNWNLLWYGAIAARSSRGAS